MQKINEKKVEKQQNVKNNSTPDLVSDTIES